jgi:hypothetical protein
MDFPDIAVHAIMVEVNHLPSARALDAILTHRGFYKYHESWSLMHCS